MEKEEEILLSIDPRYTRCNICQRFFRVSILAFTRQPKIVCYICFFRKDSFTCNLEDLLSEYPTQHNEDVANVFRTHNFFVWFNSYRDS